MNGYDKIGVVPNGQYGHSGKISCIFTECDEKVISSTSNLFGFEFKKNGLFESFCCNRPKYNLIQTITFEFRKKKHQF